MSPTELFWIFLKWVIYGLLALVVMGQVLPLALKVYRWVTGDLSGKIEMAFSSHPAMKELVVVRRVIGMRDTYVINTGKNLVSFDDLVSWVLRAEAAMGIDNRIISFERAKRSNEYVIGFGMNKSEIDAEGRKVGTLKWKEYPPPYRPDKSKLFTRTTVNLGIQGNGVGILANWMQSPFMLVGGPTGAGKSRFLSYVIAQTSILNPSHWTIVSTEKGMQDWLRVSYSPSVWDNYDPDIPVGEFLRGFEPLPNIVVITEIEQFKNAVAELSEIIQQRKALMQRYGAVDIRQLPLIQAYRNDYGAEEPEQLFLVIDDATPMEGKGADEEMQTVVSDWVSYTRTVGVHVIALLQDPRIVPNSKPDWANMRRQSLVVSLAGATAAQNKMLLNIDRATPDTKGCIAVNRGDVMQTGMVPLIDQLDLARVMEQSFGHFSKRQLHDFRIYRDKLNKVGFTGETLRRKLLAQREFVKGLK